MRLVFRTVGELLLSHPGTCRNYSAKRESLMLKKIIKRGEKISKKSRHVPEACSLHQYARHTLNCFISKRQGILNQIFMDQISDLMTTGVYADELYDHGIHITQTRLTPNYHLLYVYWIYTKNINESEVNILLKKVAPYLRQELISASVMSQIPEVRFVKDENALEIQHVEETFNKLKLLDTEGVTGESLVEQENVLNTVESQLPPMTYNVFGLNYLQIMNTIQNGMRKCGVNPVEVSEILRNHQKEEIKKFDKKELKRAVFAKCYDMKKIRRASMREDDTEWLEDDFNDENDEDWQEEIEETECDDWSDPAEDQR